MNKSKFLVVALGLLTVASSAMAGVDVYVGYADGLRGTGFFPSPWAGDSGVTFLGLTAPADSGALMFVNTGATAVTFDAGTKVDGFGSGSTVQIWDSLIGTGISIAPGDKLILTATSYYDFDSSDYVGSITAIPVVHYSIDGNSYAKSDSGQVLNTGGYDIAAYGLNESYRWRLIGGNGSQAGTPAPAAAITMLFGLAARSRRRKS